MRRHLRALMLLGVVSLSAAGQGCQTNNPAPSDQTRARIDNRSSLDMDISVTRNDGRASPLGLAPAGETTTFALAPGLIAGAAWVRFQAKPVHGSGETVVSEPFPVSSGDEISWSISPQ